MLNRPIAFAQHALVESSHWLICAPDLYQKVVGPLRVAVRARSVNLVNILPGLITTKNIIHLFPHEWDALSNSLLHAAEVRASLAKKAQMRTSHRCHRTRALRRGSAALNHQNIAAYRTEKHLTKSQSDQAQQQFFGQQKCAQILFQGNLIFVGSCDFHGFKYQHIICTKLRARKRVRRKRHRFSILGSKIRGFLYFNSFAFSLH